MPPVPELASLPLSVAALVALLSEPENFAKLEALADKYCSCCSAS